MPPKSTRSRLTLVSSVVGRRVEREQRDVVTAREQLDRQRVVAEAAAAIHARGAGCNGEDLHDSVQGSGSLWLRRSS